MSILKIKYVSLFVVLLVAVPSYALDFQGTFDSKNHPKAKGAWVIVNYPSTWVSKEGKRPNIVQKFVGKIKDLSYVLQLQIKDVGAPIEEVCQSLSGNEFAKIVSDPKSGLKAYSSKKGVHEFKPSFIYNLSSGTERAGLKIKYKAVVMTVCYKNLLISTWCYPYKYDNAKKVMYTGERELKDAELTCGRYFNSLVLMDLY